MKQIEIYFKAFSVSLMILAFLALSPRFKKNPSVYFKFVGNTTSTADLINPQYWVESIPIEGDEVPDCVSSLEIYNNIESLIYSSGINYGKPKVDNTSYGLRADVLQAGGHGSPSVIQSVVMTDYTVHVGTCQPGLK